MLEFNTEILNQGGLITAVCVKNPHNASSSDANFIGVLLT
jgi:hypothetical protein